MAFHYVSEKVVLLRYEVSGKAYFLFNICLKKWLNVKYCVSLFFFSEGLENFIKRPRIGSNISSSLDGFEGIICTEVSLLV